MIISLRTALAPVALAWLATSVKVLAQEDAPRDPLTIELLPMDLTNAQSILRKHDLDDDGTLNETERKRLSWDDDAIERFDMNRDGKMEFVEITMKLADKRADDGIVQMDSILAERYTKRYDANGDNKLSLDELAQNTFTDQAESFDKNSDGEVSQAELLQALAIERQFRTELGIKGCDQGGAMVLINRGDQDGDKRLSEDELAAAKLSSKAMKVDRDGDGKLSVSEIAEILAKRRTQMGLTASDQIGARKMMRLLDRDRSGVLEEVELQSLRPGPDSPKLDQNGDKKATESEVEEFYAKRRKELGYGDEAGDRALTLIQRNDKDGSKTLSKSELEATGADHSSVLSPKKLTLIDKDKDGSIGLDELARYLQRTEF